MGSKTYGVAKSARLIAVKVTDGDKRAPVENLIWGIDWAIENAKTTRRPSVILVGTGVPADTNFDDAVGRAAAAGILVVQPVGDDGHLYDPGAGRQSLAVTASSLDDGRAYFGNYGPGVDLFAPGLNIKSAWIGGQDTSQTLSGTAQAAAHAAGVAASLLSRTDGPKTPADVKERIVHTATRQPVADVPPDTANLLLFLPSRTAE